MFFFTGLYLLDLQKVDIWDNVKFSLPQKVTPNTPDFFRCNFSTFIKSYYKTYFYSQSSHDCTHNIEDLYHNSTTVVVQVIQERCYQNESLNFKRLPIKYYFSNWQTSLSVTPH